LPGRDHDADVGQRDQVAFAEPARIVAYLEAIAQATTEWQRRGVSTIATAG